MEDQNREYQIGELRGDMNAIKLQLEKIEGKIDHTDHSHSRGYEYLEQRISALERFRARVLGGAAVSGVVVTTGLAVAKIAAAGLLP